ncbi:Selenocysteine lyase/Cysteine desulfurase [Cnuella takakiae]|uniref:Selenocysteine lyase/Cysteine desulfurase n=1 Tax=Cnuella takakiae TaxID=1302690 RepID=A0A1M4VJQ3_9BACT|nr:aminotransferase class V-fold PLP-dependent enzyme [Cnuella takakiae]OLY92576.1 aminotransferase V [Cnuella takakiae]SHE69204.1 Selenocysteine lyase/Cysteine desulfurase [Cnuella takakiae]
MKQINRRSLLKTGGRLSLAAMLGSWAQPAWSRQLQKALTNQEYTPATVLSEDEDFWYYVQQAYTTTESVINLNNGGVSPAPRVVQDAVKRYLDFSNEAPSYHMLRILDLGKEKIRRDLALLAGVPADGVALQRNATEALQTIIFGLPLKAGDEVVLCRQDYPSMIHAWQQRASRDGIKLVWANLQLPSEDNDYLVHQYTRLFTPRTRLVHLTHMINWNGQILPVRRIADQAHARGIEVLVDGAQSFAQLPYAITDLGADYFAASLHKWLSACIGTGMLYVKAEHIGKIYPLFAAENPAETNIRKFEHLGTKPSAIELATGKAIEFHQMIGSERKQARLQYLKNYWMEKVMQVPKVRLCTSLRPEFGCAIGLVNLDGIAPVELDNFFFQKYRVHTTPVKWGGIEGVRVTPNVYTSTRDLNVLVQAINQAATKGLS